MKKKIVIITLLFQILVTSFFSFLGVTYNSNLSYNFNMSHNYRRYIIHLNMPYDIYKSSNFIESLISESKSWNNSTIVFRSTSNQAISVISDEYTLDEFKNFDTKIIGYLYVEEDSTFDKFSHLYGYSNSKISAKYSKADNHSFQFLYDYALGLFGSEGVYYIFSNNSETFESFESFIVENGMHTYTIDSDSINHFNIVSSNPGLLFMLIGMLLSSIIYAITSWSIIRTQHKATVVYHIFGATRKQISTTLMKEISSTILLSSILAMVLFYILYQGVFTGSSIHFYLLISWILCQVFCNLTNYIFIRFELRKVVR